MYRTRGNQGSIQAAQRFFHLGSTAVDRASRRQISRAFPHARAAAAPRLSLGGGFSPIIATALAGAMGGTAGLSMMMILLALITFTATLCARETKGESLTD